MPTALMTEPDICPTLNLKVHCRSHGLGTIILTSCDLHFTDGIIVNMKGILACHLREFRSQHRRAAMASEPPSEAYLPRGSAGMHLICGTEASG